jgi:hypothetical protein
MKTTTINRRRPHAFSACIASLLTAACVLALPLSQAAAQSRTESPSRPAEPAPASARIDSLSSCIIAANVDFGNLGKGEQKTLRFSVCNTGQGEIRFQAPYATSQLTEFTIAQSELDKLKNTVLSPGACVELAVSFRAAATGTFKNVVRFWANTRNCRDTSIMTAMVTTAAPAISGADFGGSWVTTLNECTRSGAQNYPSDVTVSNAGARPFTVEKIELAGTDADAGFFKLDNSNPATTVNKGDVINPGATRKQRVLFLPNGERAYSATLRLITNATPPDTVESQLAGVGVESHVTVSDLDFGDFEFKDPGDPNAPGTVLLNATNATRTVTVTNVRLTNATDFAIAGFRRADNTPITLPFTMTPTEIVTVDLLFKAQSKTPEQKTSDLIVEGDFSRCDDSLGMLTAKVHTAIASVAWTRESSSVHAARVSPNPVATVGTIALDLPAGTLAVVEIFDGSGQRIASLLDRMVEGGRQEIQWDASSLPSGIYYCRISAGRTQTIRPILVMH